MSNNNTSMIEWKISTSMRLMNVFRDRVFWFAAGISQSWARACSLLLASLTGGLRWWRTCLGFLRMSPNICLSADSQICANGGWVDDFLVGILPLQPCSIPSPVSLALGRLVDPTTLETHMWAWLWKWLGWPPTVVDHSTHDASKCLVHTILHSLGAPHHQSVNLHGKWKVALENDPQNTHTPHSLYSKEGVLVLGRLMIILFDLSTFNIRLLLDAHVEIWSLIKLLMHKWWIDRWDD